MAESEKDIEADMRIAPLSSVGSAYRTVAIVQCNTTNLVVPGNILVKPGERITFQTVNAGHVTLMFPVVLFDQDGEERRFLDLCNTDKYPHEVTLTVREVEPGVYPYVVYAHRACDFAVGGSHPKVIVRQ